MTAKRMTAKRWQRVHRKVREDKCACGSVYHGPYEGVVLSHYNRCRQRLEYQVETVYEPREGPPDDFPPAGSKDHASLVKRHVTVTWEDGETDTREISTSRSAKSYLEKAWYRGCRTPIDEAIQIAFLDTIVLESPDPGARAKRLVSKAAKATAKASVPLPLEPEP